MDSRRDRQERPHGLLFHYTGADGLLGILKDSAIRATQIRYLNDSEEFTNALSHIDGYADGLEPEDGNSIKRAIDAMIKFQFRVLNFYVVSFTDDTAALAGTEQIAGDRLNQWRAYCSAGNGFSLGFDPTSIDPQGMGFPLAAFSQITSLRKCIYESKTKKSVVRNAGAELARLNRAFKEEVRASDVADFGLEWLEMLASFPVDGVDDKRLLTTAGEAYLKSLDPEVYAKSLPPGLRKRLDQYRTGVFVSVLLSAPIFKNESFFEEKEWRIVMCDWPPSDSSIDGGNAQGRVEFRPASSGVIPYIKFPLELRTPNSPLRRIVVGPNPNMEQSISAVRLLLRENHIAEKSETNPNGVDVVGSKIPWSYW